jgi:hypothetical protein
LRRDLSWGVKWGIWFAIGYSVLALVPALIRAITGATTLGGRAISFFAILSIYFASGLGVGLIVGLCRPWLSSVIGAFLVGIVCGVPVALAVRVGIFGLHDWSTDDLLAGSIFAVVLGGLGGVQIWRTVDPPSTGRT